MVTIRIGSLVPEYPGEIPNFKIINHKRYALHYIGLDEKSADENAEFLKKQIYEISGKHPLVKIVKTSIPPGPFGSVVHCIYIHMEK
jgi:hypothetical protein